METSLFSADGIRMYTNRRQEDYQQVPHLEDTLQHVRLRLMLNFRVMGPVSSASEVRPFPSSVPWEEKDAKT